MPNKSDEPLVPSEVPSEEKSDISPNVQAWSKKVRAHFVRMDTDPEYRQAMGKRVR